MGVIGVVTGLASEAACLDKRIMCRVAGADQGRAGARARDLIEGGCRALVSFGLAGALDPSLKPGTVLVGDGVVGPEGRRLETNHVWREAIAVRLENRIGILASVSEAATDPAAKAALFAATGALAVDMESFAVATAAAEAGLPFIAIRTVIDPADALVPAWTMTAVREDGTVDGIKVARGLLSKPGDILALMRLAGYSRAGHRALRGIALRLGPSLGFPLVLGG